VPLEELPKRVAEMQTLSPTFFLLPGDTIRQVVGCK
jgi:hypothetical protein